MQCWLSRGLVAESKGSPAGTQLYTIDKLTGAASLVGSTLNGFLIFYGLGFASDGTLFANGLDVRNPPDGRLFTVDLATGAETDVGAHGAAPAQLAYSGLAFRPDGTLLSLGSVTASTNGLYAVDPATGAATLLGNTPGFGVSGGLTFAVPEPSALLLLGAAFGAGVARRSLKTRRS